MSWRERVEEALRGENTRNDRNTRDESPPNVPSVPSVPADPKALLREWGRGLNSVDPAAAPDGFTATDWWRLWDDACWLAESHGRYAALNGWDAQALFGVWVDYPPAGGIAQVMRGSRAVLFDGPRAVVRCSGVPFKMNVAAGRGLPTIWELAE